MEDQEKYWQQIRQFVRDQFGMPGEVYDIVFLIGVREMGYGFQQLDQDTKTKVFNFASIYLMNFMSGEERKKIRSENEPLTEANGHIDNGDLEASIYKQAIINYFREKKIL
ncbi:MAG: hypothetical protein KGY60_06220 [Bacteroidales bacterium]|nr:hypothetical protein [Bacteroidales bacterium]